MTRNIVNRTVTRISDWVKVSTIYYDDLTAECAVLTRFPFKWEIDEEEVPARDNMSYQEVYGYIENTVKPAYSS